MTLEERIAGDAIAALQGQLDDERRQRRKLEKRLRGAYRMLWDALFILAERDDKASVSEWLEETVA